MVAVGCGACGPHTTELPPVGEVLVVIDTDMPVPAFVSRLRIDVYTAEGVWYESRDLSRAHAAEWPTSFGLYLADPSRGQTAMVRLRAYPEGEVRDYRGERYVPRPPPDSPFDTPLVPEATGEPRLVRDDGADATPRTEPAPLLAIDRLVRVRIAPSTRASVHVLLHGACVGTMADISGARSCIDTENTAPAVLDEVQAPADRAPSTESAVGRFDVRSPCTASPRPAGSAVDGSPLYDEEVCVDGTMFMFGSNVGFGVADADDVPKRVAILPPFRMDRYEVTVARWRDAVAHGFRHAGTTPVVNDSPMPTMSAAPGDPAICTFSRTPRGREDFPVNCIAWEDARSYCRWMGGDLPSEAEWEYVASDAGRSHPTAFPWGGDPNVAATCDQTAVGRGPFPINNECNADARHFGPLAVNARGGPGGDVSLGLGVVHLAGNVSELMRDAAASLSSNCWASQALLAPECDAEPTVRHAVRGGSWSNPSRQVFTGLRLSVVTKSVSTDVGFRCVRPGS